LIEWSKMYVELRLSIIGPYNLELVNLKCVPMKTLNQMLFQ
jgi:hypothetical protein